MVYNNGFVSEFRDPEEGTFGYASALIELRQIDRDAARAVLSGVMPPGVRWAEDYPTAGDIEAAELLLQRMREGDEVTPFGMYEIVEIATSTVVGGIGFHRPPDRRGAVEIGYGVVPSHWDQGFGTQAVEEAVELAQRHGAGKVTARTLPPNVASRRVLEKAGFSFSEIVDGFAVYEIDISR